MSEQRQVSEEIKELFDKELALRQCRDECIRSIFKSKKAIYYAQEQIKVNRQAWKLVYQLWPEAHEGTWTYRSKYQIIEKED